MKYDSMYMQIAEIVSNESRCPRTQVGCLILAESGMTALGFNGHASGGPNEWEFSTEGNPEVVHAELNALGKMLEQGVSAKGATVYVTLSPCLECSKLLVRAKVKRVVYSSDYRKDDGINYLHKYGVIVDRLAYSDWGHEAVPS
jgi:dCMP deaminase